MGALLLSLIFLLWPCLCHCQAVCSVRQAPPVLVAFSGESVHITCEVIHPITVPPSAIFSFVFRYDQPGTQLDVQNVTDKPETLLDEQNHIPRFRKTVRHRVTAGGQSAVYYCRALCTVESVNGNGTYIHVRDTGYVKPSSTSLSLCFGLITLCVLLLLLSGAGTYLVVPFFWKGQKKSSPWTRKKPSAAGAAPGAEVPEGDVGGSLYTVLGPRSDDVYDVLQEEPPKPTDLKPHADHRNVTSPDHRNVTSPDHRNVTSPDHRNVTSPDHRNVTSPARRPKPQARTSSTQGKPQGGNRDKPPLMQKPHKVLHEASVYENIKR